MLVKTLVAFNLHEAGEMVEYAKADAERLARAGKVDLEPDAPKPKRKKKASRKSG